MTACGGDPSSQQAADQAEKQPCSDSLRRDYNALADSYSQIRTVEDAQSVRAVAVDFRSKYQGTVCTAQLIGTGEDVRVDVNARMDSLIAKLDRALATACPTAFLTEYNEVVRSARAAQENHDRIAAATARAGAVRFKNSHAGTVCNAVDERTHAQVTLNASEKMDELIAALDLLIAGA